MTRISLLCLPILSGCFEAQADVPPPPVAKDYKLDPAISSLYVQVFKDPGTLAAGLSHDHVVVATGWSGNVKWDNSNVTNCKVTISVPTSGLVNDETAMRQKVGYTTVLDDGQRAEVKDHMLSDTQLNAASFGTITFTSTACASSGDAVNVTGNFNLHGVSKTITIPMKISATDQDFSASGLFTAKQSDFGITPFTALGGALKNKDEIKFVVKAKGKAQ